MDAATPCVEWDVRTLVNHVVGEDRWVPPLLAGLTIAEVGDTLSGDLLGDEPQVAWDGARRDAEGVVSAVPDDRTVALSAGPTPVAEYLWQLAADHLIHAWDLATAVGIELVFDDDLAAAVEDWFRAREDGYRQAGRSGRGLQCPMERAGSSDYSPPSVAVSWSRPAPETGAQLCLLRCSPALREPWVAESAAELVAGATDRVAVRTADAKSGARFERLNLGGVPHFLKVLSAAEDWIMRVTGNTTNWEFRRVAGGDLRRLPAGDRPHDRRHGVGGHRSDRRAVDPDDRLRERPGSARGCSGAVDHHRGFLDHMARFHAEFLGWQDDLGLQDPAQRFLFFAPENIAAELRATDVPRPIAVADRGWRLLPERAPRLHELVRSVHRDPAALAAALRTTPQTFVPGDWKLGNLGRRPDGRTILLDWAYPGEAAPCWDLTWYLALNPPGCRSPRSRRSTTTAPGWSTTASTTTDGGSSSSV